MSDPHPPLEEERRRRWPVVVAVLLVLALVAGVGLWFLRDRVGLFLGERCEATALEQTESFRPDQMNHASTIVLLAVERDLPARAGTIAIATAIQESKLQNLTYGDRDSVGLFQQRPSQGWGTPEQIMNADRSIRVFYGGPHDPNGSTTRGLLDIRGWQSMAFTDAAQAVQISAYPDRYGQWEDAAYAWLKLHG